MNKTEVKLDYKVCDTKKEALPVIIVAAGSSSRMGGTNKQFLPVCGVPVLARTLMTFENSPYISRIILVVRDEDIFAVQMLCEKYSVIKVSDIVCGGSTRTKSVLKGFSRLADDEENVLIHDGARPLVTEKIISSVAENLRDYHAVAPAVCVKDTIKILSADRTVQKTADRSTLFAVQTPQGVRVKDYLSAINGNENSEFTDDLSVIESAGLSCFCVEGDYKNIKITTPDDVAVAERYLTEEEI